MIKVVIADDEVKVCQLICNLIDWQSVDMEIVGIAYNGVEALELVEDLQPDLVITDIRMPGCDGLEMIRRGKQIKEDIDFIIISGYSHFEYAQSAIKYGVSDYLLKPINKRELLDTLDKIRQEHRQKAKQLSSEEQLRIQLQSDIDKLRSGFFTEILLRKGVKKGNICIDKLNKDYHFKFAPGYFQVFIVKVDCEYKDIYESGIKKLEEKIAKILREFLKQECFDIEICFQNSRVYCVLNYGINNKKIIRKKLKACLDEILVQKNIFDRTEFTIGLGIAVEDIKQLRDSLKTAEWATDQRLIEGTGKLLESGAIYKSGNGDVLMANLTKNMEKALEVLNLKNVIAAIDSLKEQLINQPNISGQEIFHLVMDACNIYRILLRKHQLNIDDAERFYDTFSLNADLCSSASELFEYLSKVIGESMDIIIEDKKQADIKPICIAKQYIQQNYMKPITLKDVSSFVGFNDSYFSSLFKKESGKNFLEYLSEVRMDKAKELLKETDLCIANICEMVGYTDLKYFRKSFKKYTGLRPNEYRKLYA